MVRLFFIGVFYKHDNHSVSLLHSATDLSTFGFFQRSSVAEFMRLIAKTVVGRCEPPSRTSIQQQGYLCHAYLRADRLCGVVLSDADYPNRVAHSLLAKMLEDFSSKVPAHQFVVAQKQHISYATELNTFLVSYQNPKEADAMTKIQCELDETKIILHDTINGILERGEKLDTLVERSDDLSLQSKMFYKTARKTNQCCQLY